MILSLEQFIRESGDKLETADKEHLEEDIKKRQGSFGKSGVTTEELKAETDRIAQSSAAIFQKVLSSCAAKRSATGRKRSKVRRQRRGKINDAYNFGKTVSDLNLLLNVLRKVILNRLTSVCCF